MIKRAYNYLENFDAESAAVRLNEIINLDFAAASVAVDTTRKVRAATVAGKGSKALQNLPSDIYSKVSRLNTGAQRGLVGEHYVKRHIGVTLDHQENLGDAIDGAERRVELKNVTVGRNGLAKVDVNLRSEADYACIIVDKGHGEFQPYAIPMGVLRRKVKEGNHSNRGYAQFALLPNSTRSKWNTSEFMRDPSHLTPEATGQRANNLQFLADAGVTESDLQNAYAVRKSLEEVPAEKFKVLSIEEVLFTKMLVTESKFGLIAEAWVLDHLETAKAQLAGSGDGILPKGKKAEVKFASADTEGKITVNGIRPSEFNQLYIVVDNGNGELEIIRMSKATVDKQIRKARTSEEKTGFSETNEGVYALHTSLSEKSKVMNRLRRYNSVDLDLGNH